MRSMITDMVVRQMKIKCKLLCVFLLLGVLCGCGAEDAVSTEISKTEEVQGAEAVEDATETVESTETAECTEKVENTETAEVQEADPAENRTEVAEEKVEHTAQESVIKEEEQAIDVVYKGDVYLTDDTMVPVLDTLLSITRKDLKELEELPLTEKFFNESLEKCPYISRIKDFKEINIEFWSMDAEGKCICLIDVCKEKNPSDNPILCKPDRVYSIELDILNHQIDGMTVERVR